jgi:hypothetical protein
MKMMSVKEFRDSATRALKSKEPLIIMRRGAVAGIFFPTPLESIPFEFRKDIFLALTDSIKKKLRSQGVKEQEILEDFERHRKSRLLAHMEQ